MPARPPETARASRRGCAARVLGAVLAVACALWPAPGLAKRPSVPPSKRQSAPPAKRPSAPRACSCYWKGPFLQMAKEAPIVVRAQVVRHRPEGPPIMDILVSETLAGFLPDPGLAVLMGDGKQCRPTHEFFPPGTEWVFALDGPESRPGKEHAISICGEHWLRVEKDEVVGSIDGDAKRVRRMPFDEFRGLFPYPRFQESFSGRVTAGERFRRPFGFRFEFLLEPAPSGWTISVREPGRDEDLARLTPPFHFAPNPREIEGWHLSGTPARCLSRRHATETGPGNPREFVFSPDVGRGIDGPRAGRTVWVKDVEEVGRFGRGALTIDGFGLGPGTDGCPTIEWMAFSVKLEGGR